MPVHALKCLRPSNERLYAKIERNTKAARDSYNLCNLVQKKAKVDTKQHKTTQKSKGKRKPLQSLQPSAKKAKLDKK